MDFILFRIKIKLLLNSSSKINEILHKSLSSKDFSSGAAKISVDASPVTPAMLAELVNFVESGKISGKIAKDLFPEMFESGKSAAVLIEEKGLSQQAPDYSG